MKLEDAFKVTEVSHKLDRMNAVETDAKAKRFSKNNRIILAFSKKHIYIETYSGPSRKRHELKRINKRTILYDLEVKGKEDWEPI